MRLRAAQRVCVSKPGRMCRLDHRSHNLSDDGYAANHLRPPQEPVETDGLCDDPGAVSKVAIRDTEPKLHRIIDWCRHEKVLVVEFRKLRFTRKRRPG
jgi:hypothetical protein